LRNLLEINPIHHITSKGYRSKYVAPRICLVEHVIQSGFWHGYGYYKTDWKDMNLLNMETNPSTGLTRASKAYDQRSR